MLRVKKREGHYSIKIVDKLPSKGNSNWLYAIRSSSGTTSIDILYEWNPFTKEFESVSVGNTTGVATNIQAGTNVTLTGTGTVGDPYIVNSLQSATDTELSSTTLTTTLTRVLLKHSMVPSLMMPTTSTLTTFACPKSKLL